MASEMLRFLCLRPLFTLILCGTPKLSDAPQTHHLSLNPFVLAIITRPYMVIWPVLQPPPHSPATVLRRAHMIQYYVKFCCTINDHGPNMLETK